MAGSDTYGWGPGWTALGDSQQLQSQQRRKLEAIDKQVKPPMVGPPSLRNEPAIADTTRAGRESTDVRYMGLRTWGGVTLVVGPRQLAGTPSPKTR